MAATIFLWDKRPYFLIDTDDLDPAVADTLDRELSYQVPDAEHTTAYKNGEWDGYHRLFRESSNDSYYFPVGLLTRVTDVLDMLGVEYVVEGLTYPGKGDMGYEWNTDMTLRDYQQEATDEAISHGSGMVVLPTGAGKTLIGLRLMYRLQHPTVIFVHRQEIAEQWAEQIEEMLGVDVARNYGGDHENGDVMVALYQSVYDTDEGEVRDDVDLRRFEVSLFDEAHNVAADTFAAVARDVPAQFRFGFTATPDREDNATLRVIGATGPIIADLSPERLIDEGYLAEPDFDIIDAPKPADPGAYDDWHGEYDEMIVKNQRRNKAIAEKVRGLEKPTLVTVERKDHGEMLEALMKDNVGDVAFVHGNAADRPERIQQFRDGDLPVMIATRGIVGEGFDVSGIASIVIAGGMKSKTSMIQQVGRALRPGTEKAVIVDFWDHGRWVGDHSEKRIRAYRSYYGSEYGP